MKKSKVQSQYQQVGVRGASHPTEPKKPKEGSLKPPFGIVKKKK